MIRASSPARRRLAAHAFTLAALAAWAAASWGVPAYLAPNPLVVLEKAAAFFADPVLAAHVVASILHVVSALAIAFVLGTALALLAHYVAVTRLLVHGRIAPFFNSFSGIGWTMLAILWFGLNAVTVVFAIATILLPISIINMAAGLQALDAELVEMGRSFSRNGWRNFRFLVMPALYPFMFATLRISFGVAWKVALTAELFGGNSGFGFVINLARQSFDTGQIFAVIAIIVVISVGTDNLILAPLQRRLSRHYADG